MVRCLLDDVWLFIFLDDVKLPAPSLSGGGVVQATPLSGSFLSARAVPSNRSNFMSYKGSLPIELVHDHGYRICYISSIGLVKSGSVC